MFGEGERIILIDLTIIHLREEGCVYLESSLDKLLRAEIPFRFF